MSSAVTYTAKSVPTERIRRFTLQPREYFDPAEIAARAESMKAVGQQMPVTVERIEGDPKHDYELIDGESRWRSAKRAGIKSMLVLVRSAPFASADEKHLASLVANFNRSEHTPMEISNALQRQITGGMQQVDLAKALGKSSFWVSDHLLLQKLDPKIQALLNPRLADREQISLASAVALSTVPVEKQAGVLASVRKSTSGRVTVQGIKDAIANVDGCARRQRSPSRQRRIAEHALKNISAQAAKLGLVPHDEAQRIFQRLKDRGELSGFGSVDEVLASLGHVGTVTEGFSYSFPDLPVLREGASDAERADHEQRLRSYWLNKAGAQNADKPFLAIAYPYRADWQPWVPTTCHKGWP